MIDHEARRDEAKSDLRHIWGTENPRLAELLDRCDVICTEASPARQAIFAALIEQRGNYVDEELDYYLSEWAEADEERNDPHAHHGVRRSDF